MPTIDLKGWDTQLDPMAAIEEIVKDCLDNHVSPKMAISYIYAVCCEWRQ